ncbi:MAG TPA: MarR family transcriptional regulator [Anaerolineales bacterium]|nr:MarR family transcriptional regulator [Anaerolineales bacterium]HNN12715.1 MarR family transcriptional regulator [Anaerolineales bacterium]HNO30863.1 MarR family transcriptional regulator [Anaerolineales bacterium]
MAVKLPQLKQDFTESLSQISRFWGFPKGMGAIFGVLYLSESPLSLDEIVEQTGLTKGAVSTEVRTLARMGLVHRSAKLGDRKDYYEAETDFYASIRSILKERQNGEFDRALRGVREILDALASGNVSGDKAEIQFLHQRIKALQDFFNAIDSLTNAVIKLESLGLTNVTKILGVLK